MDPSRISQVKHLYEVEHLTMRQIADELRMCHKTVSRIITGRERPKKPHKPIVLKPYLRLIEEWYAKHPSMKATQVYEHLKDYGYTGKYTAVSTYTRPFRKRRTVYHELDFLPGEVAQVDWMEANLSFGKVYGFVFILAWSRYLFVRFYPRSSMEFFLDGHIEAYKETGGAARENWYDNLKSVIIRRRPELVLNTQFLDFSCHYHFAIHPCTPGRANEKGRVERVIRDIRSFVEVHDFADLRDLNAKTDRWRKEKNERVHRATQKTPAYMISEEPLLTLPVIPYRPYRVVEAVIGKTAFVEFDTNRYSVPTDYAGMAASVFAYPGHIEIMIDRKKIARHERSFGRYEKVEHPSHRVSLLRMTPRGKYERMYHLMKRMGKEIDHFFTMAESEGENRLNVAHGLFRCLLASSKEMLLSVIREANSLRIHKLRYIESLLGPKGPEEMAVYPQNTSLLDISYQKRELTDYDDLA